MREKERMRRISLRLLAASSLLFATLAGAATRPRYGGSLRVEMKEEPVSLDPASASISDWPAVSKISRLLFDTLVTLDEKGQPQPELAVSWQSEPGGQRWQFQMRQGVTFPDGTPLTAEVAAASLRTANPEWKVVAAGDSVVIQCSAPNQELPAELALARNSIVKRGLGNLSGTGPFTIVQWNPGKDLTLSAREDYWRGRPYVDSIEIEMGKSPRAQAVALDLNKADVIEIEPEQQREAVAEGQRTESSQPSDLVALVFARDPQNDAETHLRQALAFSIDRMALNNVVLQGGGEPAGGLLPDWLSGYEFVFPSAMDLARARQERGMAGQAPAWTLAFDPADAAMRVIAERVALNARDAGLTIQLAVGTSQANIQLIRLPLASRNPYIAVGEFAREVGLAVPSFNSDTENGLYSAERALLQSQRIIPLLHLRQAVGLQSNVENWIEGSGGEWDVPNVWMEPGP
jgi:peptide/nickel transport system substrate-binding protein